jgi:hypothetical protein
VKLSEQDASEKTASATPPAPGPSPVDKISRKLSQLRKQKFYGDVIIKVKDGEIMLVTITQSLLPENI